jgi:hypothetical protein
MAGYILNVSPGIQQEEEFHARILYPTTDTISRSGNTPEEAVGSLVFSLVKERGPINIHDVLITRG